MVPLVVILDLDRTLVGNTTSLISHWLIMKQYGLQDDARSHIIECLKEGVARPYFMEFIKNMKHEYKNVEYFIYTASSDEWAKIIIECFEELYNIHFNRPIFARQSHCVFGFKLLISVIPDIVECINSKYVSKHTYEEIRDKIVIFDDCPFVYEDHDDMKKVIQCPAYKQSAFIDTLSYFPIEIKQIYYHHMADYLKIYMSFDSNDLKSYDDFIKKYEKSLKQDIEYNIESVEYWKNFDVTKISKRFNNRSKSFRS